MEGKREKTIRTIGIKAAQVFVAMVIMVTAGIGLSGKVANAASQNGYIELKRYNDEGENASYEIGNHKIVMENEEGDEEICIYKEGELIEEIEFPAYDMVCLAWIIDDVLYYSKDLEIYCYDFYTESIREVMTIEPMSNMDCQEYEPCIEEIILYYQSWLYLRINNGCYQDESFIRINLENQKQEIIMECSGPMDFLGVYNNYMYFSYSTMDAGWVHGFSRISLGEHAKEEVIQREWTSSVFMSGNKIYYLEKKGDFGDADSILKCYDMDSEAKTTLKTWKNYDMEISEIKNGVIYLHSSPINQEFQYNISTGEVKNIKYIAPLKGIKVLHKLRYTNKKRDIEDVCKITWDKSFEGNIEISYGTTKAANDSTEQITKATRKNNYYILDKKYLTSGKKYYIKIRTYKGKEENKIYSLYSKLFTFDSKDINSCDSSKGYNWNYIKNGKNIYYSCKENGNYYIYKRNTTTGKQNTIIKTKSNIRLHNATGRYFYYTIFSGSKDNLYVYDAKKKTKKKMNTKGMYYPDGITVGNGKVVCEDGVAVDFEMSHIYCFNLDGSNRKKLWKGYDPFIYKKGIYWKQVKGSFDTNIYYRYCKADMNGKKQKAVTKWIPEQEYYKIERKADYNPKETFLKINKIKKWRK